MSGGFFRGTTADQDTRFSNKQAKLMKTQKFPAELEHLVDVSKVKMDVMKPWIAKRVTEFLGGFEDEVLINFIYGLLEGKEINGKSIQLSLTGFLEKNTSKFMKELWALLLSAQNNASGVPQQFLDAKEEETKKKKTETDRITNEIQRRKDKETEQDKRRKTDGEHDDYSAEDSKRRREKHSDSQSGGENGADVQNGFRGRNSVRRSRSISKSSNSRSNSKGRSVSKSVSPRPRKHSVSPEPIGQSPQRSVSPRKPTTATGLISSRRRSHSRSLSRSRRKSPSPLRRRFRSPPRRRSPSPYRRRSRSPIRRRSPPRRRHRSPSPWRRRSPSPRRRRSPSPIRQRRRRSTSSPRSRSPVQRRLSPVPRRRRSTSSPRSRSPVYARRRYQSPARRSPPYPVRRRSPSPDRHGSLSPRKQRSPVPVRRRSPSPVRRRSPVRVRRRPPTRSPSRSISSASRSSASPIRDRPAKMKSPRLQTALHGSARDRTGLNDRAEPKMLARRPSMAMSPQRDHSDISRSRRNAPSESPSPSPEKHHLKHHSDTNSPKQKARSSGDNIRLANLNDNSHTRAEDQMIFDGTQSPISETKGERNRHSGPHNKNSREGERSKHHSTERGSDRTHVDKRRESLDEPPRRLRDTNGIKQNDTKMASLEVTPQEANTAKKSPLKGSASRKTQVTSHPGDTSPLLKDFGDNSRPDALVTLRKKQRSPSVSSDSEGSDKQKIEVSQNRKHRRSSRREASSDDSSSESEIEDRKEAKRRKKEERKLRKEERRRRHDERRRRKEEKRASKRNRKDGDALHSDLKKSEKVDKASIGEGVADKYLSEEEDTESQKKKLEIELREKALESLRAKKGIRH